MGITDDPPVPIDVFLSRAQPKAIITETEKGVTHHGDKVLPHRNPRCQRRIPSQKRKDLVLDDHLSLDMIGGEMVALAAHFGIGILLLIIIESGFFNFFLKYLPLILPKNRIPKLTINDIDDDVVNE